MKKVLIILLVLIVLAGIGFGVYYFKFKGKNNTSTPSSSTSSPKVYLGMMVHVEGWDKEATNQAQFEIHKTALDKFAKIFEANNAVATFETKPEFPEADQKYQTNFLSDLEKRGHGIGIHADIGGNVESERLDLPKMISMLKKLKEDIKTQVGIEVRHASGVCSTLDWVTALAQAGYKFTTGSVAYCLMSLPEAQRPEKYKNCANPGLCHGTWPEKQTERMHPWRMENGSNWTKDSKNGQVVMLSTSGGLNYLYEEATTGIPEGGKSELTQADIDQYFKLLDETIANVDTNKINMMYVGISIGSQDINEPLLDSWLKKVKSSYIDTGKAEWKTLPQIYDLYQASL